MKILEDLVEILGSSRVEWQRGLGGAKDGGGPGPGRG